MEMPRQVTEARASFFPPDIPERPRNSPNLFLAPTADLPRHRSPFYLDSARLFHYHAACFGKMNFSGLGLRAIRIRKPRQVRKKATVVDSRRRRGNTRDLANSGSFPDPQFTSPTSRPCYRFPGFEWTQTPRLIQD